MDEIARLDDQLRRAFEREAWSGPSLLETLDGLGAAPAAKRPLEGSHTIHEIVLHLTAWHDIVRRRIGGERVDVTPATDWPQVTAIGDAAWAAALGGLRSGHAALRAAVRALDPATLDLKPPGSEVSRYVLIQGAAQHDLYHAGQIVLIRRAAKLPGTKA